MAFNHTLSAILRGHWAIDYQSAHSLMPLVVHMLKGNGVNLSVEQPKQQASVRGNQGTEQAFAIDSATMQRQELFVFNEQTCKNVPNPNIAPNSVGVLPMSGPLTKYNGACSEPGMINRTSTLLDMMNRQNIGSIIQLIDTPGGEARAASGYVSVLQKRNKPVLSYADGMVASLGVHFSSASDEFYLSNDMDQVGSIGSYCTLMDFSGYLEKQGIKMIEIYAPQSVDKNGDYQKALAGDTSGIEADLKLHVDQFIKHVSQSRPKAADNQSQWDSGKMFYANEATKLGLADGVKSFDWVVSKAAWSAKRYKK